MTVCDDGLQKAPSPEFMMWLCVMVGFRKLQVLMSLCDGRLLEGRERQPLWELPQFTSAGSWDSWVLIWGVRGYVSFPLFWRLCQCACTCCWSLLYSTILRSRADSLRLHVVWHEWLAFYSAFLNIHWSGVLRALTWLVPHETAAVLAHSVYTVQPYYVLTVTHVCSHSQAYAICAHTHRHT